jgi:hypothetical protein
VPEAPVDGQLYSRRGSTASWVAAASGGGIGDVVGPASAVADRIAVFNGATGKIIKDGGATIAQLQPLDAELTAIAGLASAADRLPYFTGSGTASLATFTGAARNLLDDADAATMRGTLGLTSPATAAPAALTKTDDTNVTLTLGGTPATALLQAASITAGWTGTLSAARGGNGTATGISTATQTALDLKAPLASPAFTGTPTGITKAHVGLGNVDNTSDASKPVSTAQQTAIDLKVAKAGDTMTGNLSISKSSPTFVLNKSASGEPAVITGQKAVASRWSVVLGDITAESGSNAGSDFAIYSYNDAGTYLTAPLTIARATAMVTVSSGIRVASSSNEWNNSGNILISTKGYQPAGGPWADSSDARIKTVDSEYAHGLDEVLKLRPVVYSFNGNDTSAPIPKADEPVPYATSLHYQAAKDQRKFIGLVAQEVETIFPEMVTPREGFIDGVPVNDLRELDTGPLVFALVNAVKKLNARIQALEAVP